MTKEFMYDPNDKTPPKEYIKTVAESESAKPAGLPTAPPASYVPDVTTKSASNSYWSYMMSRE
jgi:hypothetical protein